MSFLVSPGVHVKEIDLTNVIPAVATTIGAIAMPAQKGPSGSIITVGSEQDLLSIYGKKVLSFDQLQMLSAEKTINDIIIAIPSLGSKNIIELKEKLKFLCNNVSFLPEKKNLMSDYISLSDIGSDGISNFLNRKEIMISRKKFKKLDNKIVLVTGAAGSIGSELCRQLLNINVRKIIALDNSEILLFNLQNESNDQY